MFRFFTERLQLPQNATKVTPTISFLRHLGGRKISFSQFQSRSPPSLADPDREKILTVSYLVSSCGLSSTAALAASKYVKNKTKERCLSVIQLLKNYGFSDAQIDSITISRSQLLIANPETSFKPKLEFLLAEGFSKDEAAEILTGNPTLFARNLERGLMSTVRFPMALMRGTDRFEGAVKKLIKVGSNPTTKMFAQALGHLCYISKEKWMRKVRLWQELGWSEDEVFDIFKNRPKSICMSDEQLRFKVNLYQKSIGWDRAFITMNAAVLQSSVEKRIIPRVSVLKVLMSKGLIKKKWTQYQFYCNDKNFIEKYVKKYVFVVPEIIQTYHAPKEEQHSALSYYDVKF